MALRFVRGTYELVWSAAILMLACCVAMVTFRSHSNITSALALGIIGSMPLMVLIAATLMFRRFKAGQDVPVVRSARRYLIAAIAVSAFSVFIVIGRYFGLAAVA